jgi:hypothetical protein
MVPRSRSKRIFEKLIYGDVQIFVVDHGKLLANADRKLRVADNT